MMNQGIIDKTILLHTKTLRADIKDLLIQEVINICENVLNTEEHNMLPDSFRYFQHVYHNDTPIKLAVQDFANFLNSYTKSGYFDVNGKSLGYPRLLPLSLESDNYIIFLYAESKYTLEELRKLTEEGLPADHSDHFGLFKK